MITSDNVGAVTAASTAIDLVLAAAFMLSPWPASRLDGPHKVGILRIIAAAAAVSIVFNVKAVLLVQMGLDSFGLMRLIFWDLVVVLPAAGVLTLTLARRKLVTRPVTGAAMIIAALAIPIAPIGLYAMFVEPFRLQVETADVPVPETRAGREPIRVGVLADIQTSHISDYERNAVDRLMALSPDIVLIPGDLWQGSQEEFQRERDPLRSLLGRLMVPGGAYYVYGNCDEFEGMRQLMATTPVQILRNEIVETRVRDRRVTIGGLGLFRSPGTLGTLERLEELPGDDDIRILLVHMPDALLQARPNSRIDLIVAGHTHGGQVCLPLVGPLMDSTSVPKAIGAGGLHELDGRRIYVSRGVGHERGQAPRLRFLCPPEISLIRFISGT